VRDAFAINFASYFTVNPTLCIETFVSLVENSINRESDLTI